MIRRDRLGVDHLRPTDADHSDGNRSLGSGVVSGLETAAWSIRAFFRQLLARPVFSGVALVIAGAVGLALLGSGRFSRAFRARPII